MATYYNPQTGKFEQRSSGAGAAPRGKTYFNPQTGKFETKTSDSTLTEDKLLEFAEAAGLEPKKPGKSFLGGILDLLNKPSEIVEKSLTGGSTYEEAGLGGPGSFAARLILDPLNLVGGLGLGTKALKGVGAVAKVAEKVPAAAKVIQAGRELFVPGAKVAKVSPELAEGLANLERSNLAMGTQAVREVGEMGRNIDPNIRKEIGKLVEAAGQGAQLTPEQAKAVQEVTGFIKGKVTEPEVAAGIAPETLVKDYFPRKVEREGIENLLGFGGRQVSLGLGGAEKKRTFVTQLAGEEAGVNYKDAFEALATRTAKSRQAVNNAGFVKHLIGGKVRDINGNPLVIPAQEAGLGYREFTMGPLKGFAAPNEAVEGIEKYYKTFVSDQATNQLLKFYDNSLGLWKGLVTSVFPSFHIRNVTGNLWNMYLGGFKNPAKLLDAAEIQRGKELVVNGTKVDRALLETLGIANTGQFGADIPKILDNALGKGKTGYLNPLKTGRAVGTALEDNSKIAFFIDRLGKGDTVQQAAAQTRKYLFDYNELTDFERNVMRRVVPFYTWMRKNIPLQLEQLVAQPGKFAAVSKLVKGMNADLSEEDIQYLPDFVKEGLHAKIGEDEQGNPKMIYSFGLPFEDIGRLYRGSIGRTLEREVLGSASPFIKAPIEAAAGKSFFYGKNLDELTNTFGKQAKDFPEALKSYLDYRETKIEKKDGTSYTKYYVDPYKYYMLTQLPVTRAGKIAAEPATGLQFFKTRDVNIQQEKDISEARKRKEIEDALARMGVLGQFTKTFIPK